MKIRLATHADIDILIDLGFRMHQESEYAFLPFNKEKVHNLILGYLQESERHCIIVADVGGIPVGGICGYISDYFFCDEMVACDMVLFVAPEYRNGRVAIAIIKAFRQWAAERGAQELCLAVSSNINVESAAKLYQYLGMRYVGGIFKQRLS